MQRFIAIAAVALALGACTRHHSADRTATVVIPGPNGSTVIGSQAAPANLPAFVKLYPGARVTATTTTPGGGVLAMEASAAPEQIMDFYKKAASDEGLPVQMDSATMGAGSSGASHMVIFGGQGQKKSLSVSVQAQNGVTKIAILYGMSPS